MAERTSRRCEMVSDYTRSLPWHTWSVQGRRCRCIISEDKGQLSSEFDGEVTCCDTHQKVLQRGKSVADYYGRVWRIDKDGLLIKTGTTCAAFEDEEE